MTMLAIDKSDERPPSMCLSSAAFLPTQTYRDLARRIVAGAASEKFILRRRCA
ncbi:hypothetical protein SFHH103_03841 [Sinorhizobium fredii HH103]|uniref:Uncharacterized protein n=1 Tax=Sinorhizobium fredii (strain HH103) TaxID=1117943 RepID=G9A622_SINF1|nr:hypothetical protein SFHH103_03841 [Sinorhizobium fredii HH103]